MIEQLLLHGIGDYFLQTDKQALNKKKKGLYGFKQCLFHCITYSLPFLLIGTWQAVSVIFLTHFIIDRTKLVDYALAWKNGVKSPYHADRRLDISNFGFSPERPMFITIWLYIITDNLLHICINYLALRYL